MSNREHIKELLDYVQTKEDIELSFDKDAIVTAYQKNNNKHSLATKMLSVFGGFLASLAFLVFLFISGLYDSHLGMLFFGALCIAGAIWVGKKYDTIIIETVSVSSFLIGFILFGVGLGESHMSENTISLIFILIALVSLRIVQNYVFSFTSVLIINGSILSLIISNEGYDLIHIHVSALAVILTYFFLKEAKLIAISKAMINLYNPIRTGLIVSFLSGLLILGNKEILPISQDYIWASSVIIMSTIIFLLSILFEILNIAKIKHKTVIYILSILVLLPTVPYPAISGAILIILLSFLVNYKTGLVLGIIAFIYFISQFYYDLNFTLLTKSILLISSGVLFMAFYLLTYKKLPSNEKV